MRGGRGDGRIAMDTTGFLADKAALAPAHQHQQQQQRGAPVLTRAGSRDRSRGDTANGRAMQPLLQF